MTDVTWTPAADTFKGTFNGNGYSIRNLSASTDGTGTGGVLFGTLENATVQNLCIVGGTITATVNNGGTLASVTDMLIKKEENFSKEKKYDIR